MKQRPQRLELFGEEFRQDPNAACVAKFAMRQGSMPFATASVSVWKLFTCRAAPAYRPVSFGWPLQRLGDPKQIGVTLAVAGTLQADAATFSKLRPANYRSAISDRLGRAA
ncbi:hypothetical protein LPU83_pLPU83d_0477 (plasmid) [Rhizobium favelukesii]|uniref:Uncharacterized protein n=1 Tax=Rhizobium favelukesii TaxID=348824 RepID=W6RST6_9HYPH|nr:hypothetical protein LPU83_pLPU83d_0477 [Rhizobium favelukesii]